MKYFENASSLLTERIRGILTAFPAPQKPAVTEITLRRGRSLSVSTPEAVYFGSRDGKWHGMPFSGMYLPTDNDMDDCLLRLCDYSLHDRQQQLVKGYVTAKNGHRAGLCGTAVYDNNGKITGFRDVSTIKLRVARLHRGAADFLFEDKMIFSDSGQLKSVLLAGGPGCGKTTILRDIAMTLSSGKAFNKRFYSVAVADERGELAAVYEGRSALLDGACADIIDGLSKAEGIALAVRNLRPDAVLCDEIGGVAETESLCEAMNSGVAVFASIHAGSIAEAVMRPQVKKLALEGVFSRMVFVKGYSGGRYKTEVFEL